MRKATERREVQEQCAPVLHHSIVAARNWERFTITDEGGRPATLAIIDERGKVLDSGPEVAQEVWELAVLAYQKYLVGEGHMRVITGPDGLTEQEAG
jgi:hypothetical protein